MSGLSICNRYCISAEEHEAMAEVREKMGIGGTDQTEEESFSSSRGRMKGAKRGVQIRVFSSAWARSSLVRPCMFSGGMRKVMGK
jgi:hypothetical protein